MILLFPVTILSGLALVDRGYLDGMIARSASLRLGREIGFRALHTQLLSSTPEVRITGLTIGNPAWLPKGNLAEIELLTIRLRFWPLLRGRIDVPEIGVDHPNLHLVRLGRGRNNWSFGHGKSGPAFAPLRGVTTFTVANGRLAFRDYARDLFLNGTFANDAAAKLPFSIAATGTLKDGPIRITARGGALNGKAVGLPYPFIAIIVDGGTTLRAAGTSGDAFDLSRYALQVDAHGPNLAGIGYMFNLITPNSAPYTISTRATSDGSHLRFDALDMKTRTSHVTGRIWSSHANARRAMRAVFDVPTLARQDINAMLAPVPPRAMASSVSGAIPPGPASRWILSDAPVSLRRIRGADFDFTIHIGTLTGYALPLTDVRTRIDLDHGLLNFPTFDARLYSGSLTGAGNLDASGVRPIFRARANVTGASLAEIGAATASPMQGRLNARADLVGSGNSLHEAASTASGSMAFQIDGATIPRQAAWILGGDLLRAALGGTGKATTVDCATGELKGSKGLLQVQQFAVGTTLGHADVRGHIDLGSESLLLVLQGQPARRRLFQVAAPVQISGPWLSPRVTVLPGRNARKLGLKGTAGLLLTPIAGLLPLGKAPPPATYCSAMPNAR